MTISIIIVHYKARKELFDCLTSIYASKPKTSYEVIVVDNDDKKVIKKSLLHKFPNVLYVPSNTNMGYGAGNNLGARFATGKYLFFLNPDTIVFPDTVDSLVDYAQHYIRVGIVAPVLLTKTHRLFKRQGSAELTPIAAIFSLSFIFKFFPRNKVARSYLLFDWDKKTTKSVAVAPGTAFVIRKRVFQKIGGFDEQFFLFFEEDDLCKRVRKLGYEIIIYPNARIVHLVGKSMQKNANVSSIFANSRYLFFKKYFGTITALIIEGILRVRISRLRF